MEKPNEKKKIGTWIRIISFNWHLKFHVMGICKPITIKLDLLLAHSYGHHNTCRIKCSSFS